MWCKVGDKEMVMVMVDSCLALCCKFVEMSLSFDSLLHTLSKIVNPPLKVRYFTVFMCNVISGALCVGSTQWAPCVLSLVADVELSAPPIYS